MTWTIFPPLLDGVPFDMIPNSLRRNVDDRVAADEGEARARGDLVLHDLFGRGEDEVEMLVEGIEDPPVRASALHLHENALVEALLEDVERPHAKVPGEAGRPS